MTSQAKLDKARAMRSRAAAIENSARIEKINKVLKARPGLCNPVCECLSSHGVDLDDEDTLYTSDMPAVTDGGRSSTASGAGGDEDDEETGCGGHPDRIPRSETTLEMLHMTRINLMVRSLEPVAFSDNNLRSLKPSAKKQATKASLLQLIEFSTGVSPDTYLGTEGTLKSQKVLITRRRELNQHNGRRSRELPLPPKWAQMGFYRVDIADGTIYVEHRFADDRSRRQLPSSQARLVHDAKALKIERNWSEMNAMLTETRGSIRYKIHLMFPDLGGRAQVE